MFAYWLMLSIFAAGSFGKLRKNADTLRSTPLFVAGILVIVVVVGLRYEIGSDWVAYQLIFKSASEAPWSEILALNDPAYMLLNRLSAALGGDVVLVNLLCAAVFAWGLAKFANQQPDPWLATAVAIPYLVIVVAMGYTRQSVAIGLMMAAIPAFKRQKYVHFFFNIAAAAAFHKTVVVAIPLIALSTVRHRLVVWASAAAIGAAVFLFFISAFLEAMVDNYVTQEMSSEGAGIRVAMTAVAAILYLIAPKRFALDRQEQILWRNFSLAALLTIPGLALAGSSTIVDRISLYLIPLQIVVLSRVPLAFPRGGKPNGLLRILVIAYCFLIQGVWLIFASHAEDWVPYYSYFSDR